MAQSFSPNIPRSKSPFYTFSLIIIIFCIILFYTLHYRNNSLISNKTSQNANLFRNTFISSADNSTISDYLRTLTLHPHLAGTPPADKTIAYVLNHFRNSGFETHVKEYNVLLSYPIHTSLSLHFSNGAVKEIPITEIGIDQDSIVTPYHAYSPSGSAYGRAVFVNHGEENDYAVLESQGMKLAGCVALVRRGGLSRNAVVEKAAEKGLAAVLMYTETEGFNNGVERGTVLKGLGDPLTPGWAGIDGGEKLKLDDEEVVKRFPTIPSIPISADAAGTILRSLEGARLPYHWKETLKSKVGRVGPGPIMINFTYQGEKKMSTISNVFAVIRGYEEPDRFVLLGNHRDAWTYGAVDPNSGTAALLDIARRYSLLVRKGWSPRRTIVLCSWDAEEFGMVGSTEWVEDNLINLGSKAVAYINVDCAVQGPGFIASATPQLDDLLIEVTKKVKDPDSSDMTLYEKWVANNKGIKIQRLTGADSDFAPFLQHAGIPSIDMYYGEDFPVYHTAFDSYAWITKYADPYFQRHVAVTGVWGLLGLHFADELILPFNYLSYAAQLQEYVKVLGTALDNIASISLHPLVTSIEELVEAAKKAEDEKKELSSEKAGDYHFALKRRILNDRLMFAERGFLDPQGLKGKEWFKHLIYGPPSCDYGCKEAVFPGISEAASRMTRTKETETVQHEIWRVARAIQRAVYVLRGDLT
ncbi:probable glutamate carboxypeptidase AMP1 [Impatiens glandulifera]|uniref:probable glutamate carboxypeptidase AMP1 n=1 Tax=Impatiens glandulifera TaxID=253017 RepID=UPI001FB15B25|nr:probable glutamate carboxypeptidase AMP1 [Impatiens glandulifera]